VAAAQIGQGKVTFGASFDAGTHRLASRGYFDQAGAPLYRLSKLSYDGAGNIRGYDEDAPPAGTVSWTLAYDSLYRLRGATATRGGARLATFEYWHDLASNVTRSDETAPGQALGYDPVRPDLVTGTAGAATQYTYDAAGRVRSTPTTSDIRWGARDRVERLTSAGAPQVDLIYDHDRELLAADTTTTGGATVRSYFFSAVHERHGGVDYYFAPIDGRQAVAAREDGTFVVLARGMADSIARAIDGSGTVVAGSTELYAPFGTAVEAASKPWPRGFAGAVRAPNGVYLMGARPYLSGLGHFGAPDPVLLDPLPKDLLFDPRRVSPYGYALANPHAFVDPTGRLAFIDDAIFYLIGRAAGVRSDPPGEGILQNFKESWSVLLRSVFPFHSGTTLGQVAAWPVQVTWGLAGLIIGTIAAYGTVEVMGATTRMEEHVQLIAIPGSAGNWAFTVGNKVVGYETTLKGHWHHEQGHYFQNLLLGPLYFPIIALPSVIHDKVHHIVHPGASLDDFYTEHWATAWG
jgi:RHS repeat-associated protein